MPQKTSVIIPRFRVMQMSFVFPRSGLYLLNPFVFGVRSASALQCSRFVSKLWKPHVHMLFEACWLKRLLQHMGRDVCSYACQADWILSFFISINNKQRQTPPTDTMCFIREKLSLVGEMVPWWPKSFSNRNSSARNAHFVVLHDCITRHVNLFPGQTNVNNSFKKT